MTSVALRTYKGRLGAYPRELGSHYALGPYSTVDPSSYPLHVFSKLEVDLAFLTQLLVYSRASSPATVSKDVGVVYIAVGSHLVTLLA